MDDRTDFTIELNGSRHRLRATPLMPLLYVLRDLLGETATRFGCGDGQCGACTVLIDGEAVQSCTIPISAVSGPVETAAALAGLAGDHPILRALLAHTAGQCGYCLSGIAMQAKAFLQTTPNPTRSQIAQALDGNLCRCGAHNRILDALTEAAEQMVTRR